MHTKNSDPLYYDNYGVAIIPLGTITVQEIQAPEDMYWTIRFIHSGLQTIQMVYLI